jgi:hypothetical protein
VPNVVTAPMESLLMSVIQQGTTIEYGGDRAGASLSSMGWTGKRGDSLPPVWVVVHKA